MSTETIRKPHPNAIATVYGWALPETGEILVSKRGLPNPVKGFKPNRPFKMEDVIENTIEEAVESVASVVETEPEIFPENELPIPTTPEDLDKLLGSDTEPKGPGRPRGSKDKTQRIQPKRGSYKVKAEKAE